MNGSEDPETFAGMADWLQLCPFQWKSRLGSLLAAGGPSSHSCPAGEAARPASVPILVAGLATGCS
jgi:hypothetical protein